MLVHIVDDNHTNLMLFEQLVLMSGEDVEVETYTDPLAALSAALEHLPDLVLVDYMMPKLDGHGYLRSLHQLPGSQDVPVVMVTASNDRAVRQKALDLGATDFLAKPVDPSEVKARLRNLLALRRSTLQLHRMNRDLADGVRTATATVFEREQELIWRLSKAAEFRDPETGGHIARMAHYSQMIARRMGLNDDTCDLLLRAAPMHDLGKLGIPDGILLKPGKLTDEEFRIMAQHPQIGYEILSNSRSELIRMGASIALSHHEKFDGSGYPNHLAGACIPLLGRIVAVADVFDALTSERPYKRAWDLDRARALLVDSQGSHFDPECVQAFLQGWGEVLEIRSRFAELDTPSRFAAHTAQVQPIRQYA